MATNEKITLTDREKEIVEQFSHSLYTVEYLEEWINRNDNVFINAPAALNAMGAKGFYDAVRTLASREGHWVFITGSTDDRYGRQWFECSECGHKEGTDIHWHCPECGIRMKKDR